jgi:hypothetical protein
MFTQTYQRLEGREQPGFAPPAAAPVQPSGPFSSGATGFNQPAMTAPPVSGQSEFTRILDASRMREMGLRGGSGAEGVPQAGPAAQPAMPPVPPPQPPPPGGFAGYPMPGYPAYTPPAAPQMAAPAMPAAPAVQPAPDAKTPQVLPLILIGVILLLVVVVIALVFLMKR